MIKTLEWIESLELEGGGIAARPGADAYPEVSGYLIPTLIHYGRKELARRLADWLVKIQGEDGSFLGLDGTPRTFDTAACMEGLMAAWKEFHVVNYSRAALRAKGWIEKLERADGAMRTMPGSDVTHIYSIRASWLIGSKRCPYMKMMGGQGDAETGGERAHYLAYALEGILGMGDEEFVMRNILSMPWHASGLIPFWIAGNWQSGTGTDVCASAQVAILGMRCGLSVDDLVEAVRKTVNADGSLPLSLDNPETDSWTAKWYLDMEAACGGVDSRWLVVDGKGENKRG